MSDKSLHCKGITDVVSFRWGVCVWPKSKLFGLVGYNILEQEKKPDQQTVSQSNGKQQT